MKRLLQSIAAALMAVAPVTRAQQPALTLQQQQLLAKAESTVKNYIAAGKRFPLFAMAEEADGKVMSFLPNEEFDSDKQALVGVLGELIPRAKSGQLRANVLVTAMAPEPGTNISWAIFDLEQQGAARVIVMLPYEGSGQGATYGERVFKPARPKLFVP